MKILKKKKKNFFFGRLGIFFSNWEKSHLNPIGKGAEFGPGGHQKKSLHICAMSCSDRLYRKFHYLNRIAIVLSQLILL